MGKSTVNLRSFKRLVSHNKRKLRSFIGRLEKRRPKNLQVITLEANELAWAETNCLDCANCCKTMSPTYSRADVARIAAYLGMSQAAFRKKWLYKDNTGDWINKKQPCQFLDANTNLCTIYPVRPRDCAGFPYHSTKKIVDYAHMYRQNVEYCPATYRLIEQIQSGLAEGKWGLDK
ncbi:MAG TPA: YkgJ family cysteine cluster protein [Puia sp.]|nr:YkgJ family cysteine cluster protein [Puia sp.]